MKAAKENGVGSQGVLTSGRGGVEVHEKIGMRRWMRLAARKHSATTKVPANDSAKAAADAIAQMLKESRRHA